MRTDESIGVGVRCRKPHPRGERTGSSTCAGADGQTGLPMPRHAGRRISQRTRRRRNRTPACLHAPWVEATSEHQPDSPPHAVRLQIFNSSSFLTNAPMMIDSYETTLTILHIDHEQDHFLNLRCFSWEGSRPPVIRVEAGQCSVCALIMSCWPR